MTKAKDLIERVINEEPPRYPGVAEVDPDIDEVTPPGWEKTVRGMKKHPEIDNPWALSWYMKGKGYEPRK